MMSRNSLTRAHSSPKDQQANAPSEWSAHSLIFSLLIVGIGGFELIMGTFLAHLISAGHGQGVPLLAALSATPIIALLAISLSSRRTKTAPATRPSYLRVVQTPPILGVNEPPLEP